MGVQAHAKSERWRGKGGEEGVKKRKRLSVCERERESERENIREDSFGRFFVENETTLRLGGGCPLHDDVIQHRTADVRDKVVVLPVRRGCEPTSLSLSHTSRSTHTHTHTLSHSLSPSHSKDALAGEDLRRFDAWVRGADHDDGHEVGDAVLVKPLP